MRQCISIASSHFILGLIGIGVLAAALCSGAFAQGFVHGTFFVFGLSSDFVTVAIDSRGTSVGDRRGVNDRFCKIRPLSPKAFFFVEGAVTEIRTLTMTRTTRTLFTTRTTKQTSTDTVFDSRETARQVYAAAKGNDGIDGLAEKWGARTEAALKRVAFPPDFLKRPLTEGFFVGTNDGGDIAMASATIRYNADSKSHFGHSVQHFTPLAHVADYASAYPELVREFLHGGQTDRAKKIIADRGWASLGDTADAEAARDIDIVGAVRDWSGNKTIGGDIAAIILERGKNWRWFHRPTFCPEK